MKSTYANDSLFEQTFARMPLDVQRSFTSTQMAAMRQAFGQLSSKKHAIDIRHTVPVLGRGFYLVLLAGAEHRAVKRLRRTNPSYPYFMFFSVTASALLLGILATAIVLPLFKSASAGGKAHDFQTEIPWLLTKAECENTNRVWAQGACWDKQHDPNF